MAQLNVKLSDERVQALRRYAGQRRTPVAWLIKDYIDFLLAGGTPVAVEPDQTPTMMDLAAVAQLGGALDWLIHEQDSYTLEDGEQL